MSLSAPLGYPDWQRLQNWDGPVLWQVVNGLYSVAQLSPVMRTDRYQSIGGSFNVTGGAVQVTFAWYADQALTALVGQRVFYMSGSTPHGFQFRLVNLAAWCQITLTPIGANFTLAAPNIVAPSNRAYPSEMFGGQPVLLDVQNQNVAAGATSNADIPTMVAGKGHLWGFGPFSGGFISLAALTSAGVYDKFVEAAIDSGGEVNMEVILPPHSLRLSWKNTTAAAASYGASLVHSGGNP